MKKLFLCSTISLVCAGAQAQSSVTIFGVVDVSAQHFNVGGLGSINSVGSGGLTTSRFGFRGAEDLGGGLKAGFWLESSVLIDTGSGRSTNTNNQTSGTGPAGGGLTFDRVAYVSLSGPAGELRLGHDFVPTQWNSIIFDPFSASGVARAGNLTFTGAGAVPLPTGLTGSNTISYWLPKLGGLYGTFMVGLGENSSNTPNSSDGNFSGFRLGYAKAPFDVAVAMTRTRYVSTATIGDYTHANVGASYDAGFARFFALYNVVRVDLLAGQVAKNTAEVGVNVPVGSSGRIRMSYSVLNDRSADTLQNAGGSARSDNDARQLGLGYVHDLSKRAAVYTSYARLTNRGQATYTLNGGRAPLPGQSSSGLELGIRHLF